MKKTKDETTVGMFVIVGFIMLSLMVFFVSGVYLFRPGYAVNVLYDYVSILDKGAPVRMAGVRVGEVSKVDLIYDEKLERTRVNVKLFIEKGVQIRENYLFKIQGTHILSEPHIEVSPVEGHAPVLQDGKVMEGVPLQPMEALIERSQKIADNLDSILSDKGLKGTVQNLESSSESMSKMLDHMQKGEGTAGKLVMSDELHQELLGFVAEIKAHPWRLMKKDGGKRFFFF